MSELSSSYWVDLVTIATHLALIVMCDIHHCYSSYSCKAELIEDIPAGNYNWKGKHSRIAACVCAQYSSTLQVILLYCSQMWKHVHMTVTGYSMLFCIKWPLYQIIIFLYKRNLSWFYRTFMRKVTFDQLLSVGSVFLYITASEVTCTFTVVASLGYGFLSEYVQYFTQWDMFTSTSKTDFLVHGFPWDLLFLFYMCVDVSAPQGAECQVRASSWVMLSAC